MMYTKITNEKLRHLQDHQIWICHNILEILNFLAGKIHLKVVSNQIRQNEITFLTPESVSVLYEGLSTKTKVYVFHQSNILMINMEVKEAQGYKISIG